MRYTTNILLAHFGKANFWGFLTCCIILVCSGCTEQKYPRPKGFPRLDLPAHTYQTFDMPGCPFTFEFPAGGKIVKAHKDSCDVNIHFDNMASVWHITYQDFSNRDFKNKAAAKNRSVRAHSFEEYRRLIYKHSPKATEIYESALKTPAGKGSFFEIYGEVPTSAQIYVSDSSKHALMASFYFNTALKNDSLAPIIDFMKEDLKHMANTIRWK